MAKISKLSLLDENQHIYQHCSHPDIVKFREVWTDLRKILEEKAEGFVGMESAMLKHIENLGINSIIEVENLMIYLRGKISLVYKLIDFLKSISKET